MNKPNSVIVIPCNIDTFFKKWFEFLEPYHRLTTREMDVATAFVKQRYSLSKVITDEKLLDEIVMNEDTKRKIREECNLSLTHFQVIMTKLKRSQVIKDNKLNPKFIPNFSEEDGSYKLLLFFKME